MDGIIKTPILIIAFNRPDISRKTYDYLKQSNIKRLYVAVDGPRKEKLGEQELVEKVKEVYSKKPDGCEVFYKFNDRNLGAEVTVSNAISWVFKTEETVIILEDDVLAPQSFLTFAQEMLEKYRDVENIYQICGAQFTPYRKMSADYTFSVFGHTGCGWATFKRAWKNFRYSIEDVGCFQAEVDDYFTYNDEVEYVNHQIKNIVEQNAVSWDWCWEITMYRNHGLSIVPRSNLTKNIGYYGLHGNGQQEFQKLEMDCCFQAKAHPKEIAVDSEYSYYHYKKYLYVGMRKKVRYKLRFLKAKICKLLGTSRNISI